MGIFHRPKVRVRGSVVDQDIQLAVLFGNVFPHRFNLVHLTNVASEGFGAAAVFPDAAGHGFATVNLAAADNHMGAVMSQRSEERRVGKECTAWLGAKY